MGPDGWGVEMVAHDLENRFRVLRKYQSAEELIRDDRASHYSCPVTVS